MTEKPTFRNSTTPINLSSPAEILTSFHHLREPEDHMFPYRVSYHAANDISRKWSRGIAKSSFTFTLPSSVLLLLIVLIVHTSRYIVYCFLLPVQSRNNSFFYSWKPVRLPN